MAGSVNVLMYKDGCKVGTPVKGEFGRKGDDWRMKGWWYGVGNLIDVRVELVYDF